MILPTSKDLSTNYRYSGILAHPTSFPSPYGVGDFGKSAYTFIDFLEAAGQHIWQILPLVPTTSFHSPYQGYSVSAGESLLISPDLLLEDGLLSWEDLSSIPSFPDTFVEYDSVISYKEGLYEKAFEKFQSLTDSSLTQDYTLFCKKEASWLDDYCLFMALKAYHENLPWMEWDAEIKNPTSASKKVWEVKLQSQVDYYRFLQFIFYKQWSTLKLYANEKNIAIVGDIPIFVALDSADVWAHRDLFLMDDEGFPTVVAGVPPDYFCETGQLWGNPLYNWDYHKKSGYAWWISRIENQLSQVDYLRIDHFRGFEAYWAVPAGETTALNGTWEKGPGADLFHAIQKKLGNDLPIFAEDLGLITKEVEELRDAFDFPGMKVLQFAFEGGESSFLPHQFDTRNCLCYTGTHDNDTSRGWYDNTSEYAKDKVRRYMNTDASSVSWDFIRICLGTIARYAIFPLQDVMKLDSSARMNTPGVADGNWAWRYKADMLQMDTAHALAQMVELFGR